MTSLAWSHFRREIAVTFGFAHPEHPCRIAVFSWPDCEKVAAVPWEEDHRALHAVAYSCILENTQKAGRKSKAVSECLIVASSDESIKFHELWAAEECNAVSGPSMFGGSDILEDLQGIMKDGDVIR